MTDKNNYKKILAILCDYWQQFDKIEIEHSNYLIFMMLIHQGQSKEHIHKKIKQTYRLYNSFDAGALVAKDRLHSGYIFGLFKDTRDTLNLLTRVEITAVERWVLFSLVCDVYKVLI